MIEAAMQLEFAEQPLSLHVEARKVAEDVGWHFQKFNHETHKLEGPSGLDEKSRCLWILFGMGLIARVVSYASLAFLSRFPSYKGT